MRSYDLMPAFREARSAIAAVIAELLDDGVPLVGQADEIVLHGPNIMGRRVPGSDLIIGYVPAGEHVFIVNTIRRGWR